MTAKAAKAATAWGDARVVDEVTLPQGAGERAFAAVVQVLEGGSGERYVRFAYTTDGTARRGPVTFREHDLTRLRDALGEHPELARSLAVLATRTAGRGEKGGGRRGRGA